MIVLSKRGHVIVLTNREKAIIRVALDAMASDETPIDIGEGLSPTGTEEILNLAPKFAPAGKQLRTKRDYLRSFHAYEPDGASNYYRALPCVLCGLLPAQGKHA